MINIEIAGKLYPIRFDLYTMELMEAEGETIQQQVHDFRKRQSIKDIKKMFKHMANSALNYLGQKENVTGEELRHCDLADISEISRALNDEMMRTMHTSMTDGAENGEGHQDVYAAMMEAEDEKNGETGGG